MRKAIRVTSQLIVVMVTVWIAWLVTLLIIDLYIVTVDVGNAFLTAILRVILSVALFGVVLLVWYKVTKYIFRKNIERYLENRKGRLI